jgi:hypothetical protein
MIFPAVIYPIVIIDKNLAFIRGDSRPLAAE